MKSIFRILLTCLTVTGAVTSGAARQADFFAIERRYQKLFAAADYSGALAEAQRLESTLKARFGAGSRNYSVALFDLAYAEEKLGKYAEAAELYHRALAIKEKALGPSDPNVALTLNNLANVYSSQGKYAEAAGVYQRALAIRENALGPSHPDVAQTLTNLADVYKSQGKYAEAVELLQRAQTIEEKTRGPSHPNVGYPLTGLADVYDSQGKYAEAAQLLQRALSIREKALGPSHPDVAGSLNNLATAYERQGKYAEAAELNQRALAIAEKALGPSHPLVAVGLNNLASVYDDQGKYAEAAALYQRALAIQEKVLGPSHPDVANSLYNLALVYESQGKYAEAAELSQRALAIKEKALGPSHPDVAQSLNNLAGVYGSQGKYTEAAELYQRALAIEEKAFGPSHPYVANFLNNLAGVYESQGKSAEAVELLQRVLAIDENTLGPSHPFVARSLNNLALVQKLAGKHDLALAFSRKATAAVIAHAFTGASGSERPDKAGGLIEQSANYFVFHVANLAAAAREKLYPASEMGREGFEIAQWAVQSSAGLAVQQMALRFASGNSAVAALVRENQDLAAAWRGQDKALVAALSKPEAQQDRGEKDRLRGQLGETEAKLAANAARLEKDFPDYAALANPKPLKVEETQKLLRPGEALVFVLAGDKESYVFALTSEAFDWQVIPLGKQAISDKVAAFRRGLDVDKLHQSIDAGKPELFDLTLAQEFYASLLGPIDALIKDKSHLLIVPTGPLTALPFHLLVTQKPAGPAPDASAFAPYRDAAFLVKRQAITVLPSVPSLKALRFSAREGQAAKILIGFGDPVFRAEENVAFDGSKEGGRIQVASRSTRSYADYWQGVELDRARLADVPPLPDTADELRAVAKKLGAPLSDIHLGRDASETTVKRAPLADYRVVYFATHALVAGDVKGLGEPALLLSLPRKPSDFDDGLLTASEVAQLKLNADFVVLSACNTAAGDKPGAEALSGLARAFFYAGARALLVSHWAVDSRAAVRLTTETFGNLQSDPEIGRAEALRRAMLAYLNDTSDPRHAYPAFWAPFSIVGEGAGK
ncbi:MAG: tetratricopeptide repeat protein [Methylocella sp.]